MRRYIRLVIYSFAATLFYFLTAYVIGAAGVTLGNEQQAEEQLSELIERGTLTEDEFLKLGEEFKKSRVEKAVSIDWSDILAQRVRLYSRFITWLPWFLIGFLLVRFSPLEFVVLMLLPVLLLVADMFTLIDILIYGAALVLGLLMRPWLRGKRIFASE